MDPLADLSSSHTPYNYAYNDPVYFNDPDGDYEEPVITQSSRGWEFYDEMIGGGSQGFNNVVAGLFGGPPIPQGTMSAGMFVNHALYNSPYGGSWNGGGSYHYFRSDKEAYTAGAAYNDYHNSWKYTGKQSSKGFKSPAIADFKMKKGRKVLKHLKVNENWRAQRGPIPGITILEYNPFGEDGDQGVKIRIGYNDPQNRYSEYRWIQTVRTNENRQAFAESSPFNDAPGDGTPYFWTNSEQITYSDPKFQAYYWDNAGRTQNAIQTYWQAELTIGGMKNGVFHPIGTMTYGFQINYGILTVYPLVESTPTQWHLDSFTNTSKW